MEGSFWWNKGVGASLPGATISHELCGALRAVMLTPPTDATLREIRELTRCLVTELRDEEYEPQTVLLHVKEVLQRASIGLPVDDRRLAIWKRVIDWTIGDYYRAD